MNQNNTSGKSKGPLFFIAAFSFLIFPFASFSQLVVNGGGTPASIISALAGAGLTITNVSINCGSPPNDTAYGTFNGSASNIGLQNGVILTCGSAANAQGPNLLSSITGNNVNDFTDPDLTTIDPGAIYDVCMLEFDVVPHCSFMEFRFVFGSDEYPEFVNTAFNDAFGFFVTGPDANCNPLGYNHTNVAILPSGTPVSINNINNGNTFCPSPMPGPCVNCAYYVDNCGGATVEYDGFTTPIVVVLNVCPCATYHWKFIIADVGDHAYDSGVFLDYLTCASPFAYNLVTTQAACGGVCDGTAAVNITSGTPPYSFLWSNGATTQSITGLCPGNYSVDVLDAISCGTPLTQNFTITGSPAMTTFYNQNNVDCNGGITGTIVIDSVTGGLLPLHYLWSTSPNDTLTTLSGLQAGSYTVTITDAYNCTSSQTIIITEPTLLTATINPAPVNVSCNGGNDGAASVVAGGGTAGYNYVWTSGATVVGTTASVTGLSAGNYVVTVIDAYGCTASQNVVINQPTPLIANLVSTTDALCTGDANGSAVVNAGGGTPGVGYTYVWSPSGGTNATATGLIAGTYDVVVTDANGCTTSVQNIMINEPTLLVGNLVSTTDALCTGDANGSAVVNAGGGTPGAGYMYVWSPSGGTNATATGLIAGTYDVVVTDANGCTTSVQNIMINEPTVLVGNLVSTTDALCNGDSNGSAVITAGGGTPGTGYAYAWSPSGGTNASATGLIAGTYDVVVTDANGCTASVQNIMINEPILLVGNLVSTTDALCNGDANGSAVVNAVGGTVGAGYGYAWSPSGGTSATATGLMAGSYDVVVTDANGCSASVQNIMVNEPTPVTLAVDGDTTICIGQNSIISAVGNGGVSPFNFVWDNGNLNPSQVVAPTSTVQYSVTVTDANGCSPAAQSVLVTVNPPLNVNAAATPSICFGTTATISASAGGGNGGPYSYSWNNGAINNANAIVTPDHDSTFTVVINDGCSPPVQTSVNVIVNSIPQVNFYPFTIAGCPPLVVNFLDSTVAASGSFYHWSFGDDSFSSSQNPSHVYSESGVYDVSLIVRTPEGCSDTLDRLDVVTVLDVPTAMFAMSEEEVSMYNSIVSFTDLSSGAVWWNWNFGDGIGVSDSTNPVYRYDQAGIYTIQLVIQNSVGCLDTTYSLLRVDNEITLYVPTGFTPNGDNVNDYFKAYGIGIAEFDMWVYNRWGTQVFHTSDIEHPWNGANDGDGKACQNDVYVYRIIYKDVEGVSHDYIGHVTLVR